MGKHIFGPVHSRRLGRSLGIDIVPKKICNLNCVYCEVGPTTQKRAVRDYYFSWDDLKSQFHEVLEHKEFDVITLTGMGEPTLNRHLPTIVQNIKALTDKPMVLLTNSLLLIDPEVRAELHEFSVVSPSLDAVLMEDFQRIDRPVSSIVPMDIIEGLIAFRKEFSGEMWLEVLLAEGYNDSEKALTALKEAIDAIKPDKVHLNSVGRPPLTAMKEKFANQVKAIPHERLEAIAKDLGPLVEVIAAKPKKVAASAVVDDLTPQILEYLKRRPADAQEISQGLNVGLEAVQETLGELVANRSIGEKAHGNLRVFYRD